MKLDFKEIDFSQEKTCKKNDNPISKQLKHVPAVETCEDSGIQTYFHSIPSHNRDVSAFLPIEVVVVQIYLSKLSPMPSMESVKNHLNHLKRIKQRQMLDYTRESRT